MVAHRWDWPKPQKNSRGGIIFNLIMSISRCSIMTHPQGWSEPYISNDEIVTCQQAHQNMVFPIMEHGRPMDMMRLKLFTCEAIILYFVYKLCLSELHRNFPMPEQIVIVITRAVITIKPRVLKAYGARWKYSNWISSIRYS